MQKLQDMQESLDDKMKRLDDLQETAVHNIQGLMMNKLYNDGMRDSTGLTKQVDQQLDGSLADEESPAERHSCTKHKKLHKTSNVHEAAFVVLHRNDVKSLGAQVSMEELQHHGLTAFKFNDQVEVVQ